MEEAIKVLTELCENTKRGYSITQNADTDSTTLLTVKFEKAISWDAYANIISFLTYMEHKFTINIMLVIGGPTDEEIH